MYIDTHTQTEHSKECKDLRLMYTYKVILK